MQISQFVVVSQGWRGPDLAEGRRQTLASREAGAAPGCV